MPDTPSRPDVKELLGAVARGWCHPKNAGKEFDADLAVAIAAEINALRSPSLIPGLLRAAEICESRCRRFNWASENADFYRAQDEAWEISAQDFRAEAERLRKEGE